MTFRKFLASFGFASALATGSAYAQSTETLIVYTALENDQLVELKNAIEAAVDGVEIQWVRDSTGVITARFLAERDNPQADMVFGIAASSLLQFENLGLLAEYKPAGSDELKPQFHDSDDTPTWTGMDAFLSVVCYNTIEGESAGTSAPASWADLIQPEFEGRLVMPNPASSGTGYLTVAAWIQSMGEEEAWAYMDELHQNIASYTHSGSAPCVQAARGERVAGISLDMRGARERSQGAPIEVILPEEGTGWDMEAYGIVEGTDKMELAQQVADWAASREANEIYSRSYAIVAMPGVENTPANYPENAEEAMIENDFTWMAENRDRILEEWSRRYDAKSEPRQ